MWGANFVMPARKVTEFNDIFGVKKCLIGGFSGTTSMGFLGHLLSSLNTKSLLSEDQKMPQEAHLMVLRGTPKGIFCRFSNFDLCRGTLPVLPFLGFFFLNSLVGFKQGLSLVICAFSLGLFQGFSGFGRDKNPWLI